MEKVTRVLIRFLAIVAIIGLVGVVMIHFFTYQASETSENLYSRSHISRTSSEYRIEAQGEMRAVIVLYQGGLVETASYLVLADLLSEEGITVIVPRMPLNLAILGRNRALEYVEEFNDVPFYLMGHSLGAASAAFYAEAHSDTLSGLIFLAGYPSENTDLSDLDLRILSVTASEDLILDSTLYENTKNNLPAHTIYSEIEGGNHAQFGSYGSQRNDGVATISENAQHRLTVEAIITFLGFE